MMWSRCLLTLLACTQLSLVAMQRYRQPDRTYVPKEAPEGVSLLVDRIANSKYGLLGPIPGKASAAQAPMEEVPAQGIPLDQILIEQTTPQPLPASDQSEAPPWLWPVIQEESQVRGLDPLLIESMIRQESGFRPDAVSPAGAQGLMQLMPETAQLVGVSDPFDAKQNVAGGSQYMAWQMQDFGGDLSLALAAYNAGPAAVRRWGGIPPYGETNNYVRSVLEDYHRKTQTAPMTSSNELQGYSR
ncbi:lytic transglycosylase domain-containing protein [bacterium]|nr:lytic transglycosylase domain-containing protein [bacterium]